jgi:PhnB protein
MKEMNAYLNFDGNCREAMEFYAKCLDGELEITPFSATESRIMHARLSKGSTTLWMASDVPPGMALHPGNNVSMAIQCESLPEIEKLFGALAEKGNVRMPLQDTFWGARFGMLTDQFGIHWMLNFELPK